MPSFCLGCGNSMLEGQRFCEVCGRDSQADPSKAPIDPAVAFGLPSETSGKAIFSLISGILFLILPFSIVAVVFGYLSLYDIRRSAGRLTGKGLAVAGIILGYVGVAVIVGLIGLGIYGWRSQRTIRADRMEAGETSVVAAVRTLNTAEIAYSQAHRDAGYTCSLSDLSSVWGISGDLARGRKNGYVFALQGCTSTKNLGPIAKYQLLAHPAGNSKTRTPVFCSDESDVIRVSRNGSAQDCLKTGKEMSDYEINHPQALPQRTPP